MTHRGSLAWARLVLKKRLDMFIVKTSDQLYIHDDMDKALEDIDGLMRYGYGASEITFISVYSDSNGIIEEFTWDNPPKRTSSIEPREYNSDDFLKY
tara:strand:+ start:900 stop:1190 length:291 start_codon:yes stop_codon:yes gene_type:complete